MPPVTRTLAQTMLLLLLLILIPLALPAGAQCTVILEILLKEQYLVDTQNITVRTNLS